MIDNHLYKIYDVFYVMSSFLTNFYDDEHFLIVYFIISLDENHLFDKKQSIVTDHRFLRIAKIFSLWRNRKHLFLSSTRHRIHNDVTSTRLWRFFLLTSWIFSSLRSWRIWFWTFLFRLFSAKRLNLRSFWKMHERNVYKNSQNLWQFAHFYEILISISFERRLFCLFASLYHRSSFENRENSYKKYENCIC
jgi:hypothetical protein